MITTEGKTDRQVFEELAASLVAQGGQCIGSDGRCINGDGTGKHCAAGWLFQPKDTALMEAEGPLPKLLERPDLHRSIGPNLGWIESRVSMLVEAQLIHDADHAAWLCDLVLDWDEGYPHLAGVWDEWLALRLSQMGEKG